MQFHHIVKIASSQTSDLHDFFTNSVCLLQALTPILKSVEVTDKMLPALQSTVQPTPAEPSRPGVETSEPCLTISVLFTSVEATIAALSKAGGMADKLGARIVLLVMQPVPFPVPLDDPPVSVGWNEERLREVARISPVDTGVRIYLCRNRLQTLKSALQPGSIVVIGCRKRLWPTSEVRLARELRRLGHQVILTEAE